MCEQAIKLSVALWLICQHLYLANQFTTLSRGMWYRRNCLLQRRDGEEEGRRCCAKKSSRWGRGEPLLSDQVGTYTAYNLLPLLALLVIFEEGRWWCWWDFAAIFHSHQASTRGQRRGSLFQHWTWSGLRLTFTDQVFLLCCLRVPIMSSSVDSTFSRAMKK